MTHGTKGSELEYAGAAHLLRAPSMAWAITDEVLDDEQHAIDWVRVWEIDQRFSSGERALIRFAYYLWTGVEQAGLDVMTVMFTVDSETKARIIDAVRMRCDLPPDPVAGE